MTTLATQSLETNYYEPNEEYELEESEKKKMRFAEQLQNVPLSSWNIQESSEGESLSYPNIPSPRVLKLNRYKIPPWMIHVEARLNDLLLLPENWDSYGSERIQLGCAVKLIEILSDIMADETPTPSIVPTSNGSVQAEWHIGGIDLELEILSEHRVAYYYEDSEQSIENEDNVTHALGQLAPLIKTLPAR